MTLGGDAKAVLLAAGVMFLIALALEDGAVAALGRLEGLEVDTLLFGHGDPWTGGLSRALHIVLGSG
jgi:hypothetical protein